MHGQRHHFEDIGLIEDHRWIHNFGLAFLRRRDPFWQRSRHNVGGLLGRLK
jgi:hypothetical protein